ncbi:MAG: PIN domain-containing protein [Gemmatimonadales bacterium]
MSKAYVDTSCLVATLLAQPEGAAMARRLRRCDELLASNLLEAELRSALRREAADNEPLILGALTWVHPQRSLGPEIKRVLAAGYLRGADCWHLATALYLADEPRKLTFLTLDARQRDVAHTLGFDV